MPLRQLRAYMGALPRILASQALHDVQVLAAGTGAMKEGSRAELLRNWERAASEGQPVLRPRTREGQAALAAAAGIRVVPVPRETKAGG